MTDVAPLGVANHQAGGTAIRINAIQESWQVSNRLGYAKFFMLFDLAFIAVYSFGAILGGILMRADDNETIKRLGILVFLGVFLFFVFDYVETIPEVIQLFTMQGDDVLATVSKSVLIPKLLGMLLTLIGLIIKVKVDKQRVPAA